MSYVVRNTSKLIQTWIPTRSLGHSQSSWQIIGDIGDFQIETLSAVGTPSTPETLLAEDKEKSFDTFLTLRLGDSKDLRAP